MTTEPTLSEVMRRLDDAASQLGRLAEKLEREYLPREVYSSHREADRADVAGLTVRMDKTEAQRAADRRLILTAFIAPIVTGLVLLYIVAQLGGTP